MATLVRARWRVLFSAITPPPASRVDPAEAARPSLHVFDPKEEHAALCTEVLAGCSLEGAAEAEKHAAGHAVPRDAATVERVVSFIRSQLRDAR